MFTAPNTHGLVWNVRIVKQGERYGLSRCLTHDNEDPLVEFYNPVHDNTEYGAFVSRYFMSTLLDTRDEGEGLWLEGGWRESIVEGADMRYLRVLFRRFLNGVISDELFNTYRSELK